MCASAGWRAAAAAHLEALLAAGGELLLGLFLGLDLLLGQVLVVIVLQVRLVLDDRLGEALVLRRRPDGELRIDQRRVGGLVGAVARPARLRLGLGSAVGLLLGEPARTALGLPLLRLLTIAGHAG